VQTTCSPGSAVVKGSISSGVSLAFMFCTTYDKWEGYNRNKKLNKCDIYLLHHMRGFFRQLENSCASYSIIRNYVHLFTSVPSHIS
jgi:hypothetical protein